jgi:hypothetical protein
MKLAESHLVHHVINGSLHGDAFLLLTIVGHGLVDGWRGSRVYDLANTKQGVGAGPKVLFDRLQSTVDVPVKLVLSRGSLLRN